MHARRAFQAGFFDALEGYARKTPEDLARLEDPMILPYEDQKYNYGYTDGAILRAMIEEFDSRKTSIDE